jgi:hypothetical protein
MKRRISLCDSSLTFYAADGSIWFSERLRGQILQAASPRPPFTSAHFITCAFSNLSPLLFWLQVPGNGSAPAQIWADGFNLLLGLTYDPALPDLIYAVGKLQLNASQPAGSPPLHENVVVEVDIRHRNTWSVIATLHNDVSHAPA